MLAEVAHLLLPLRCAACGRPAREGLCAGCAAAAEALALPGFGRTELAEGVEAIGGYAYEGVIRDAVVGMKVRGRFAAARPIGAQLRRALGLARLDRDDDVRGAHRDAAGPALTWVPTTPARRRARGFDLPQLLAGPAARALLVRTRQAADQTSLDARARRRAPVGAFRARGPVPAAVVLVDDVRTTGATARSAAMALRRAGARQVLVVTLAVGGDEARRQVDGRPADARTTAPQDAVGAEPASASTAGPEGMR